MKKENHSVPDRKFLSPLLKKWGLEITQILPHALIPGSPERTINRVVITTPGGQSFVLEEISPESLPRKREISSFLRILADHGLSCIHPYICNHRGDTITAYHQRYWLLRDYIQGIALDRAAYLHDSWRGKALGDFLIHLHHVSAQHDFPFQESFFSIVDFIRKFMKTLQIFQPKAAAEITPVFAFLEKNFFAQHDALPGGFSHGDYHPLNIVWSEREIVSVIDWEFCGRKPEIYDLALLTGCIGSEDPQALKGPLTQALLHTIKKEKIYAESSMAQLFNMVLALRFAWLSEWLRGKDHDMIRLEMDYMTLLWQNHKAIQSVWSSF
ncbi:MAG: phosphotransferase [Syntrophobacterales bacterium]|jgi:homoserine kinase type II|nr:phosphotransferase [Syntrophobacterales bacterium]